MRASQYLSAIKQYRITLPPIYHVCFLSNHWEFFQSLFGRFASTSVILTSKKLTLLLGYNGRRKEMKPLLRGLLLEFRSKRSQLWQMVNSLRLVSLLIDTIMLQLSESFICVPNASIIINKNPVIIENPRRDRDIRKAIKYL